MTTWLLKPIQVTGCTDAYELTADGLSMGRGETNSIAVPDDAFPQVSSRHARVALEDDRPFVTDCGSRNGTLVNGKRIEHHALRSGDIIQLGTAGPRFAITLSGASMDTIQIAESTNGADAGAFTHSGLIRVKESLGVPEDADIGSMIAQRSHKANRAIWAALSVVGIALVVGFIVFNERSAVDAAGVLELQRRLADAQAKQERQADQRAADKRRLEEECNALQRRLDQLDSRSGTSVEDVQKLRAQIAAASKTLTLYDPVKLEELRLQELERSANAVVLLDVKIYLLDPESGNRFHFTMRDGEEHLNARGVGELKVMSSCGTGFAVGAEGHIITNAHVALPYRSADDPQDSEKLFADVEIDVVFNGQTQRHRAELVDSVFNDHEDLALLQIEPFDGMPHIASLDTKAGPPPITTKIFVPGFPLGDSLVQGASAQATIFHGGLSRVIDSHLLQIHAAVYPGNSGGPVIDEHGQVIGVVKGVQILGKDTYTPTIGYIIPVAALASIWPP